MQFIDEATISVAAGSGGDGVVAWRREKYVPMGGPAGGDGGRGGNVFLEATPNLSTLVDFRFKKLLAAESGNAGSSSNKSGKSGADLIISVPVGTLVYRAAIDAEGNTGPERLFADMSAPGERTLVAKGGRYGQGNQHFATSARQAPHFAEKGQPGERCVLRLELKLLADAGLIGLPNAGKSTLLSVVSAARPKVADYPFTTLEPQLGVVRMGVDESFVMVDVPGLIEGASAGAGLGDRFLRHVERTRVLIHLIDGERSRDELLADKATIENELRAWNSALLDKPLIPVITKLDLPEARARFDELSDEIAGLRGISAATGEGVRELLFAAWEIIRALPAPAVATPEPATIDLAPNEPFEVRVEDGVYVVSGERIERLAQMTDFDSDEALLRFEQVLAKLGVEKKLRELGVTDGDTVRVAGVEFTYQLGRRRINIGIFGGGFDPIHNGHLFVAEAVRDDVGLDKVVFVPTRDGAHRSQPVASTDQRAAMVRLAIAANPAFAFDESDLRPEATGYTADLLPILRERYPVDDLYFIVGGDSLVRSRWNRLESILQQLRALVVAPRGDVTGTELDAALADLAPELRAKIRLLDLPLVAESATLIRNRLGAARSVRYLVPEPVYRYIEEWKLYR